VTPPALRGAAPAAPATPAALRRFALTVGGALAALAAVALWRGRTNAAWALGAPGVLLALAGVAAPARLGGVYRGWMRGAAALSRVTTPVWLAVVYFGVLTPMALAMRLAGRRGFGRRPGAASYWVERPPDRRRSDLRRQF
jgi:dihydrodipicolinate synthase/N-acetylneuraminate lyase